MARGKRPVSPLPKVLVYGQRQWAAPAMSVAAAKNRVSEQLLLRRGWAVVSFLAFAEEAGQLGGQ